MTSPTPMTREELIELAALDAFGLLDDYEAALYTRSFHHAPVAVQNEIKELQAAFAGEASLLPDVEPDPALRQRVLDAVSKAIEAESLNLAPLAMIGRPDRARPETAGRIGAGASTPVWRAAAFALAAALLVVAYFAGQFLERNNMLTGALIDLDTFQTVEDDIGPTFKDFVGNPTCTTRTLFPDRESDNDAFAVVYVNEQGQAFVFAACLPCKSGPFTVTATDPNDGSTEVDEQFACTSDVSGYQIKATLPTEAEILGRLTWTITDVSGTVLLQSAA
ncbi:MAG: hypothetical protein SYC29_12620 [Planctomycetota bacterium]|nr:hypothetical protein [Planctomycetota bacterium]